MKLRNEVVPDPPFSLKRKATGAEPHSAAKKRRMAPEGDENKPCKEASHVTSNDNMTKVERRTSSGRKVKIVCYRKLEDGEIDKDGKATPFSQDPETKEPLVTRTPDHSPLKTCKSPQEKVLSIKNIGKLRALRDNEIENVLHSDSSDGDDGPDYEDDELPDLTESPKTLSKASPPKKSINDTQSNSLKTLSEASPLKKSIKDIQSKSAKTLSEASPFKKSLNDTQNKSPKTPSKVSPLKESINDTQGNSSELISKKSSKKALKALPLPEMETPEKRSKRDIKCNSTIKKRFKCEECALSFSSRAELREHDDEEHDDFEPLSKTPSR